MTAAVESPEVVRAVASAMRAQDALARRRPVEALAAAREAAGLFRAALGPASADLAYALILQSRAHSLAGEEAAALTAAESAEAIARRLPGGGGLGRVRVQARQRVGQVHLARGDYAGARELLLDALADAEATLGVDDLDTAGLHNDLGIAGKYRGDFDQAAGHYVRALAIVLVVLGPVHPEVASIHHNLGGLAHARGRFAAAEPHARLAVEIRAAALGDHHPDVAADRGALAGVLQELGRLDEAEALLRRAADAFARALGDDHLEVAIARTSLAAVLHRAGRPEEAEREYRAGLAARERYAGRDHPELATTLMNLAALVGNRGDHAQAESLYRRALCLLERAVAADHPRRLACRQRLAARAMLIPRLPRAARTVLAADALSAAGSGLTLPFLLIYLHDIRGLPLSIAGLAASMIAVGSVAGNVAGGTISDHFGARNAVVLGLTLAAAGAGLLALVAAPWHAFAATAVVGLGAGIVWPAQDALLAAVVQRRHRSSAFAVRMATMNAGLGVGALAAATLVDPSSAHSFTLLYVLDGATFLAAIPLLLTLPNPALTGATARPPGSYRQVIRDKTFVRVWALTALLVALSYGQYSSAFPAYAARPGGIPADMLGLAFAANTLTVVAAQLLVLRCMAGRRRTTGILTACAGWAAAWTLTLLAGRLGAGPDAAGMFVLAMIVFGIAETFLSPSLTPIVNDLAPPSLTGRYNGLSTLAWTTGFLTGPAIAGFTLGAGHASTHLVGLVIACALAALVTLRLRDHLPSRADTIAA